VRLADFYLISTSTRAPLRVGLLLDDFTLPKVFQQVVLDIQKSNFASIELAALHQPAESSPKLRAALPLRAWQILKDEKRRRGLLFSWYTKFDSMWNQPELDPFEPIDIRKLLNHVPQLSVEPLTKGFTHRFPAQAIDAIRAHDLDVLLRFGFNILRGDVLQSARYGIWSFHHGDNEFYRGGPSHFWELVEESPLSGVILQVLSEELDAGLVLCKSLFASIPGVSRLRNQWGPYLGSTHMVIRKLHELHEYGWDSLRSKSLPCGPYLGKRSLYRAPTNAEMFRWLAPTLASKVLKRAFRRPAVYHWRIGIRPRETAIDTALSLGLGKLEFRGFRWLESPRGHFWADPFLLEYNGTTWLFFEDYRYREKRGIIGVAPIIDGGQLGEVRACLDLGNHVSYPCVFSYDGEVFMIPETVTTDNIQLHRAIRFPYEWKLEKVLYHTNAVDTTPWFDGARWWFFTTISEPDGCAVTSMIFSADTLTGQWISHPSNPFCTDVRFARNAGAIVTSGGRLFRPSQNCSERYGRNLSFNEILILNPEQYEERAVVEVLPDSTRGFIGGHTYNSSGAFEVTDAVKFEPASRYE